MICRGIEKVFPVQKFSSLAVYSTWNFCLWESYVLSWSNCAKCLEKLILAWHFTEYVPCLSKMAEIMFHFCMCWNLGLWLMVCGVLPVEETTLVDGMFLLLLDVHNGINSSETLLGINILIWGLPPVTASINYSTKTLWGQVCGYKFSWKILPHTLSLHPKSRPRQRGFFVILAKGYDFLVHTSSRRVSFQKLQLSVEVIIPTHFSGTAQSLVS